MNNFDFLNLVNEATDRELIENDLSKKLNELNLDSLDIMTITLAVESETGKKISSEGLDGLKTLLDFKKFF